MALQRPFVPTMDVFEREDDLVVKVEIPGIDPEKDVTIVVQDGSLIVRGERRQEKEIDEEAYHRMEVSYGTFERSILIPQGVDENRITASYVDGVLEVILPNGATKEVEEPVEARTIPVTTGSVTGPRESSLRGAAATGSPPPLRIDDPVDRERCPPRKCGGRKRFRTLAGGVAIAWANPTSRISAEIAFPTPAVSRGSTRTPLRPSTIWSWIPPTLLPTTGRRFHIASATVRPNPSARLFWTTRPSVAGARSRRVRSRSAPRPAGSRCGSVVASPGEGSQAAMFSASTTAPSGSSCRRHRGAHEQQMGVEALPDVTGERPQDAHVILQAIPAGCSATSGRSGGAAPPRSRRQRVGW